MNVGVLESNSTSFALSLCQVEAHRLSLLPNTPTNTDTDTDTYAHTWMHVHMCAHMPGCTNAHTQMHLNIGMGRCTHTHTHTHTHANSCQQAETLGLKRKTGVEEREESQRPPSVPPTTIRLCLWFSTFNFHIISYYIKAILLQVPWTQAVSSRPDSKFLFPPGPCCQWHFTSH